MIRAGCLAACAAGAIGLTLPRRSTRSVFILGSSVDRYAVEYFCGMPGKKFAMLWCQNEERDHKVGYEFHPGVGMKGDMKPPFWNRTRYGAEIGNPVLGGDIPGSMPLKKQALQLMNMPLNLTQFPDLVVVESSLWDISTWASWGSKNVTEERLRQWGDRDLRNLMTRVSEAFNESRVVFRSAPITYKTVFLTSDSDPQKHLDVAVYGPDSVHMMKHELDRQIVGGKLYGKYEVLDYYKIMIDLIKERGVVDPHLWMPDGVHPGKEPSRRYMNQILQLMNMATVKERDWEQSKARFRS